MATTHVNGDSRASRENEGLLLLTGPLLHPTCRATERTMACISREADRSRRRRLAQTHETHLKGPQSRINMSQEYFKRCQTIFNKYDRNGNGRIDIAELNYFYECPSFTFPLVEPSSQHNNT